MNEAALARLRRIAHLDVRKTKASLRHTGLYFQEHQDDLRALLRAYEGAKAKSR